MQKHKQNNFASQGDLEKEWTKHLYPLTLKYKAITTVICDPSGVVFYFIIVLYDHNYFMVWAKGDID